MFLLYPTLPLSPCTSLEAEDSLLIRETSMRRESIPETVLTCNLKFFVGAVRAGRRGRVGHGSQVDTSITRPRKVGANRRWKLACRRRATRRTGALSEIRSESAHRDRFGLNHHHRPRCSVLHRLTEQQDDSQIAHLTALCPGPLGCPPGLSFPILLLLLF